MSTLTRPAWATATQGTEYDEDVMHTVLIAVGDGVVSDSSTHPPLSPAGQATAGHCIEVNQFAYADGSLGPVLCNPDDWTNCDAQDCRDLAAALLKAAEIIEAATLVV